MLALLQLNDDAYLHGYQYLITDDTQATVRGLHNYVNYLNNAADSVGLQVIILQRVHTHGMLTQSCLSQSSVRSDLSVLHYPSQSFYTDPAQYSGAFVDGLVWQYAATQTGIYMVHPATVLDKSYACGAPKSLLSLPPCPVS